MNEIQALKQALREVVLERDELQKQALRVVVEDRPEDDVEVFALMPDEDLKQWRTRVGSILAKRALKTAKGKRCLAAEICGLSPGGFRYYLDTHFRAAEKERWKKRYARRRTANKLGGTGR